MAFFRLIRPLNLLIILFVQYMVRFAFLYPAFKYAGFSLQLNEGLFAVFAFAFVFMAAGGYIINDYFDVEMDKLNKPSKVIIGTYVKPNIAYSAYWIFGLLGLVMGCWASYKIGLPALSAVFLIYLSGLWFYSSTIKYQLIAGNLLVALFIALVPFVAGLVELYADIKNPQFYACNLSLKFLFYWIAGISVFAFLLTLIREIVKDIEDTEGDKAAGCRTIPIVFGKNAAKRVAQILLLITFLCLAYFQYNQWKIKDIKSLVYCTLFLQAPILFIIARINKANVQRDFHNISSWLKILMVLGISYLFIVAYTFINL